MLDSVELSIIIPCLNEEESLPGILAALSTQQGISPQIIVVDGGSNDSSAEIVRQSGVELLPAEKGRAKQLNAGAAAAAGEYLLFLHADSIIESSTLIVDALRRFLEIQRDKQEDSLAGHFPLEFVCSGNKGFAYRYYEAKTYLNRPETTNGDQGLLLTKRFFEELGGFDESLSFLEDQRIAAAIRDAGELFTLPGLLKTSARRFEEEGFSRRMILSAMIMGLHGTKYKRFFNEAPKIYREQCSASRLVMSPFFRLVDRQFREDGVSGFFRNWYRIGGYVRANAWQPFLFADVCMEGLFGMRRRSCLNFFDRFILRLLDNPVGNTLSAILTFVWFHSEWLYFTFADPKKA